MGLSLAERYAQRLRAVPPAQRPELVQTILREIGGDARVLSSWRVWARPEQLAPRDDHDFWRWWAVITGRGWGKTRTAAEWVLDRSLAFARAGVKHRVALVGATAADVRDVMVLGESGLVACAELRGLRTVYVPSRRTLRIPELDTVMTAYSAVEPNRLRGPQHHTGWGDELAAWRLIVDREGNTAWTNLDLGLRLPCPAGMRPQGVVTTTPKPIAPVKQLIADGDAGARVHLTRGTLYDNATNLSADYVQAMRDRYEGSRMGAQELGGVLLDSVEGAIWTPEVIELHRSTLVVPSLAELTPAEVLQQTGVDRVVIGVDPPGETAECGIIVMGRVPAPRGTTEAHAVVLADLSVAGPPEEWGAVVATAYREWTAAVVAAEVNQGGDMVRAVIHAVDPLVNVHKVRATVGKTTRAEPLGVLYNRGRVHHAGFFGELEGQMTTWVPGDKSPDRMDALVWAGTELFPDMVRAPVRTGGASALTTARGGSYSPPRAPR